MLRDKFIVSVHVLAELFIKSFRCKNIGFASKLSNHDQQSV